MLIKISTHRRGSRRYRAVTKRLKKGLPIRPSFITVITLQVPQPRQYSAIMLELIEQRLTPILRNESCTHFGKIKSALQFWKENGYLSSAGAIHLYAHLLLVVIRAETRKYLQLHKNDGRKVVRIHERIYRPDESDKTVLNLVLTGRYNRKMLTDSVVRLIVVLEEILAKGELVYPGFKDNRPLNEQVASELPKP